MGLVELADVVPLLACPRCRRSLERTPLGFRCGSASCPLNTDGAFPVLDDRPVLVDAERSIVGPAALSTSRAGRRWSIDRLPARLRPLWKPRNAVAARNVERLLTELGEAPRVLVVGGGTVGNGVEALYESERARVIAFDILVSPFIQFVADAHQVPLADGTVDAVVVQAVLEHVLEPGAVVAEIHRVLRPGGLVYAETPFLQPVHGGAYDFTRFTSSGHRWLFRAFDELGAGTVAGPGVQLLASAEHTLRGVLRSELAGKLARALLFWLRGLDRLVPAPYAMDHASAYWFLGRRAELALAPRDIVGYYRGAQGAENR
jgi:SAM-dependent methyltransferase